MTGARGVDVGGSFYNVDFRDGSCISLFAGCDPASFLFVTLPAAQEASNALIAQVFIAGEEGLFFIPGLTRGCEGAPFQCAVLTPVQLVGSQISGVGVSNAHFLCGRAR